MGEAFVKKHFPQVAKTRMMELVENLRVTLRMQLDGSAWMEAETKKAAIEKLNAFQAKIGFADRWQNYRTVKIDRGICLGVSSRRVSSRGHTTWGRSGSRSTEMIGE